jgi:hypothetical protein
MLLTSDALVNAVMALNPLSRGEGAVGAALAWQIVSCVLVGVPGAQNTTCAVHVWLLANATCETLCAAVSSRHCYVKQCMCVVQMCFMHDVS